MTSVLRDPTVIACTGKYHGLGNRMRAVLGARVLARVEGRGFAYTWPTGRLFGARLDVLWDFDEKVVSAAASRLLSRKYPYRGNELNWLGENARSQRIWQIRTPHALVFPPGYPSWESELRTLTPSDRVRTGIRHAFDDGPAGVPYVGVMIRTAPNAHDETLRHSPLEWYLARMNQIRDAWPDVPFYVAADTPEAFHAVRQAFDRCYGTLDKGRYNSKRALVASVVDLYLLASSAHLIGPHFSSFPQLAQRLAGAELRLETSMSATDSVMLTSRGLTFAPDPIRPFNRRLVG
ncbi:hypothetical protein OSC27_12220 [Microbacterium sp. STN6]|uniref:hypothetical protein n=1 Tax=Microbacterium sp. STN6 TaxID=2995588 RepID=UPI002260A7BE|nr:hypothetical protein [Microbacterium sp. STN6]MCX7523039.1 hypothetical protein [Microbacterium sp. STN6]